MSIFVFSFIVAMTWSFFIVKYEQSSTDKLYQRSFTLRMFLSRCRLAIKNFALIAVLTMASLLIIGDSFFSFAHLPGMQFVLFFLIMVAVDDVWFYCIHRLMHSNRFLYKHIHSVHHRALPPIPMDYLFAHPIEAMGAAFGLVMGILVLILLTGSANIYVLCFYAFYRTMHELCIHSGFTLLPEKWIGILGSSRHHYDHHKYGKGNYAAAFTYLDTLFGTRIGRQQSSRKPAAA